MRRAVRISLSLYIFLLLPVRPLHADSGECRARLETPAAKFSLRSVKARAIDTTLNVMAKIQGLPKYLDLIKDAHRTGTFDRYANFGELGLAEMGISVRYNRSRFDALNTGRPLIVVANHHLGIADGLALQYLVSRARPETRSLLFLARWIQTLLPFAVYDPKTPWGTAVPVEINLPKASDPEFKAKMDEAKAFNSTWGGRALKALLRGSALIVFPAGHVASLHAGERYPGGVHDAPNSWQTGFLDLGHAGRDKVDIVFAHVDSVNRKPFYRYRKLFGGGDKERVIWFLSEALARKHRPVDVHFSEPMSLETVYDLLARKHQTTPEALKADRRWTAELMRQFTYDMIKANPPALDAKDSPVKVVAPNEARQGGGSI